MTNKYYIWLTDPTHTQNMADLRSQLTKYEAEFEDHETSWGALTIYASLTPKQAEDITKLKAVKRVEKGLVFTNKG